MFEFMLSKQIEELKLIEGILNILIQNKVITKKEADKIVEDARIRKK